MRIRSNSLGLLFVLPAMIAACGGGSEETPAPADSGTDAGATDSGVDTLVDTGTATDTAVEAEAGPTCATALAPTDTVLEVDQSYKGGASNGTKTCPFVTVTAALKARTGATKTIHVKGDATTPVVYDEPSSLEMWADLKLSGDGPGATVIKAVGPCLTTTCAILVKGAGVVEGLRVESSTGNAIVAQSFGGRVTIRNVVATNAGLAGIVATADVQLGPDLKANGNKGAGVHSTGTTAAMILVSDSGNEFSSNGTHGILVSGGARLAIEGAATIDKNAQDGVALEGNLVAGPGAGEDRHFVNKLSAAGNGRAGLSALHGPKLSINQSTFAQNAMGLYYDFDGKPVGNLNLGLPPVLAGIVFGGATAANNNKSAGVFLCGATGAVVAGGNKWSKCAPTSATLSTCTATPSAYSDVVLANASGGSLSAPDCLVGP